MSTIRQRAKLAKQAAASLAVPETGTTSSSVIHCTSKQSRFQSVLLANSPATG